MKKYVTKDMFPEFLERCWEEGISVDFDPRSGQVWMRKDGVGSRFIDVREESTASDVVDAFLNNTEEA